MSIIKDIQDGALPVEEIPGFCFWLLKKAAWLFIALAVIGFVVSILL